MLVASTKTVRRCVAWAMVGVIIGSIVVWGVTRETLPRQIRMATGSPGGEYHKLGEHLKQIIESRSSCEVVLLTTQGSVENAARLLSNDDGFAADFALLQGGSVSMDGLAVVAPCYPEVVHAVVRKDRGIHGVEDFRQRAVVVGAVGSGMLRSARFVLDSYGGFEDAGRGVERYFGAIHDDPALEAAMVTTGMDNPDLAALLRGGAFDLLPVDLARAISARSVHFTEYEIPRGYYAAVPPVPAAPLATVATTALMTTRAGASDELVALLLQSLYDGRLVLDFPLLIPRRDVLDWSPAPLHAVARSHFDPQDHVGWLATVMETLAATKELLFALGAGLYLLWDRWRRLKERERLVLVAAEKDRLDVFLEKTLAIEAAQMDTTDPAELGAFLDEITRIKLQALQELTHEELRGDQMFSIFLMQCANLINKIQMKIIAYESKASSNKERRSR